MRVLAFNRASYVLRIHQGPRRVWRAPDESEGRRSTRKSWVGASDEIMAFDLSQLDKKRLEALEQRAQDTGRTIDELLTDAIDLLLAESSWTASQEGAFAKVWDNEYDAIFDDL